VLFQAAERRVAQLQFKMVCERPPAASLPLTEGENKALTLQALLSSS